MSKPHIPQGVLSTEPNLPDAEQTWHHWYRTFQRYLQLQIEQKVNQLSGFKQQQVNMTW